MQLQQCKQFSVLEPVKIKSDEMISEKIKLSINFWNLFWTFEIIHETLIIWMEWLAMLPHSKRVTGLKLLASFGLCGFSLGTPASFHSSKTCLMG